MREGRTLVAVDLFRTSFLFLLIILALSSCLEAFSSDEYGVDSSEDEMLQPFNNYDRRAGNWCARWGDVCLPHSKVKFASCCHDLRCVCGTLLWKRGQCQCRKPSMFG